MRPLTPTLSADQRLRQLVAIRARYHETCAVCGAHNDNGLHAEFEVCEDGAVEATMVCGEEREGYTGLVHGGIIASLLDGAMTNCLFSHGIVAVTGDFRLKIGCAVSSGTPVVVRARLEENLSPVYVVTGELRQKGQVAATATGKFMDMAYVKRAG